MGAPIFPGQINRWILIMLRSLPGSGSADVQRYARGFVQRNAPAATDISIVSESLQAPSVGRVVAARANQVPEPLLASGQPVFVVVDFVPRSTVREVQWPIEKFVAIDLVPVTPDPPVDGEIMLEEVIEPTGEAPPERTPGDRILEELGLPPSGELGDTVKAGGTVLGLAAAVAAGLWLWLRGTK